MPRVERSADAVWDGSVARGEGTVSAGAFGPLPFSLTSRIGDPGGKTNPEELLAAAHAGCYAMSLAGELARAGQETARVSVTATVTLDEVEGGSHRIVASNLLARARVQDMEKDDLDRLADAADEGCPFSALIKASGTVTVTAELEGGANGD
jgi:osmotically inducible protein OsmC